MRESQAFERSPPACVVEFFRYVWFVWYFSSKKTCDARSNIKLIQHSRTCIMYVVLTMCQVLFQVLGIEQ